MNSYSNLLHQALKTVDIHSQQTIKLFEDGCIIKEYSKNEILFTVNKSNNKEYFLLEGVIHRFNLNQKGEAITIGFYKSFAVITPHFSRVINGKSLFSVQTLTDCVIAEIDVTHFDKLRYSNEDFRNFGNRILADELSKNIYNEVIFRSLNAKERLIILRKNFPNIENLVPYSTIASYLGITNVSFSRLRKELSGK
jgi:CRP-like cAMP-binding protein